jgi:uncharacterized protein (TIGR03435 family)
MVRICLPLVAMTLTGTALLSVPAAAQNGGHGAGKAREFKFEVLSIRPIQPGAPLSINTDPSPSGFVARLSIWQTIMLAYAPGTSANWGTTQIRNSPSWSGEFYDINARVADADLKAWQSQNKQHELLRSAMRSALGERCKLAIHEEPSEAPDFELAIGKHGVRLAAAAPGFDAPGFSVPNKMKLKSGGVMSQTVVNGKQVKHFYGATVDDLASFLVPLARGAPIYDKTGLTGRYDFVFREVVPISTDPLDRYPVDQLGLELKRGTESRPVLVIDHIERPTAN